MKISFLVDNYLDKAGFYAEHGFACVLEVFDKVILFDTGQTDIIIKNANKLNLDFKEIDFIVLSHGHYDHTGGLKYLNIDKKICCHEKISVDHLKLDNVSYVYIGIDKDFYKSNLSRFVFNTEKTQLSNNIFLSGDIFRFQLFNSDTNLFTYSHSSFVKDTFPDEQYLIIQEPDGYNIITGCSHAGIINIIKDFLSKFGNQKIKSLIGGFHLFKSNQEELIMVTDFIKSIDIKYIITGHCTGLDAIFHFKNELKDRVIPIKTGNTLII
ncbi:MAG: MBL fold metallo-hydrolase [Calditerrivibrio sp.]|nr:MBL fold metallo-hydrolase [Calditerrivibrio sp.]